MSWANLKELIFQERKTLDSPATLDFTPESPFETEQSALLGCYLRTKDDVDAAVKAFSETLEWPELGPMERYFLTARLDFAWEIVSVLNTTSGEDEPLIAFPAPERGTTAQLLRWLLIDIWPYGCGRFLQTQKWLAAESDDVRPDQIVSGTAFGGA